MSLFQSCPPSSVSRCTRNTRLHLFSRPFTSSRIHLNRQQSHYEVLGLSSDASQGDIKKYAPTFLCLFSQIQSDFLRALENSTPSLKPRTRTSTLLTPPHLRNSSPFLKHIMCFQTRRLGRNTTSLSHLLRLLQ